MREIVVSKRARGVNALLQQASDENLILRSPDGREFILAEIDDFSREIELARQNQALMEFLEQRARQAETVSLGEAKLQLGCDD